LSEAPVLLLLLALAIFHIWGIIDAAEQPNAIWEEAGLSRIVWLAVVVAIPLIGTWIYLSVARPRLHARETPFRSESDVNKKPRATLVSGETVEILGVTNQGLVRARTADGRDLLLRPDEFSELPSD
jgi:hypothetical protein